MFFDPLSLQKLAIMAPFFETYGVLSAILGRKRPKSHFFNRGPKSQHFET